MRNENRATVRIHLGFVAMAAAVVWIHASLLGWKYLGDTQLRRHHEVLDGLTGDPWQYRILSEQLLRPLVGLLDLVGVPDHASVAFVAFRFAQTLAIFYLATHVYRRLHGNGPAIVGVGMIAVAIASSTYDSDLSFNTYTDVIFYLAAFALLLDQRVWLAAALVPLAVANRETALMIPVLIVITAGWRRGWRAAGVAAVAGVAVLATIRLWYGPRELITAFGHRPGLDLLGFNLRQMALRQIVLTVGVAAALAVVGWRNASTLERRLLTWLAAPWTVVHLFSASLIETRLLLVPTVVAVIPVALAVLRQASLAASYMNEPAMPSPLASAAENDVPLTPKNPAAFV